MRHGRELPCASRRWLLLAPLTALLACGRPPAAKPLDQTRAELVPGANVAETPVVVRIERTEIHLTVDEQGNAVTDVREVYRIMSADPPDAWSQVFAFWRPWTDAQPELAATVVRPDGSISQLDPATIVDQGEPRAGGITTDARFRIAPIPGLTPGALVDRHIVLKSRPQLLAGQDFGFPLSSMQPETKRIIVVDVPATSPLSWQVLNVELEPRREERDGRILLTFELGERPPRTPPEPVAPREVGAEPVLRLSTVKSWREAASAWAARAATQLDVEAVRTTAAEVTAGLTERDAKVRALLAWLRKNVRYNGLEIGESAWIPTPTREVLARRYGDCKDLSLLLVALLRGVGIDADLALVRAGGIVDVADQTPGLSLFDHVIVRLGGTPSRWLDPTALFLVPGELPWALVGRKALVARPDTDGLTPITAHGESTLDSRVELTFAELGPGSLKRTRRTDGIVFAEPRRAAADSAEEYRRALEKFTRDAHGAKGTPKISASDPFAAGLFEEVLEVPDTTAARTEGDRATATLQLDYAFSALDGLFFVAKQSNLKERKAPIWLPAAAHARVENLFVPPIGFAMEELPADVSETVGPVTVALTWKHGAAATVEAALEVKTETGVLTPQEARHLLEDVLPKLTEPAVVFENSVLKDINKNLFYSATRRAEEILRQKPSPAARALLAYALANARLQEAAEDEARRALKDAPDNVLVRNRVTFVMLHNPDGVRFGAGYRRDEAVKILDKTVRDFPDDEWARRLRIIVSLNDAQGVYLGDGIDAEAVLKEIHEYRDKTKSPEFDEQLYQLLTRRRDWKALLAELPDMPQTPKRDAAWLAADVAVNGVEPAMRRAGQENRAGDEAIGLATQYLMATQQYAATASVLQLLEKRTGKTEFRSFIRMVSSLKPCALDPADPRLAFVRLVQAALTRHDTGLDKIFADPTGPQAKQAVRLTASAMAGLGSFGSLDLQPFICDLFASAVKVERTPVAALGELITLQPELQGLFPPMTVLTRTTRGTALLVAAGDALVAAEGLKALEKGDEPHAQELFRMVVRMSAAAPASLRSEGDDWARRAPVFAAYVAAQFPETAPVAVHWTVAQLDRTDLTDYDWFAIIDTLRAAWHKEPKKLLELGRRIKQTGSPGVRGAGLRTEIRALEVLGEFAAARDILDAELIRLPNDLSVLEMREGIAAGLGQFEEARRLAVKLAGMRSGNESGVDLNNAAWYAVFAKPDEEAIRQAERSVELNATLARGNTLATLYASMERWDEAMQLFMSQIHVHEADEDDDDHNAYWYLRGLLAEGFGRPQLAVKAYLQMRRAKNGTADDTFRLAQPRLKRLGR